MTASADRPEPHAVDTIRTAAEALFAERIDRGTAPSSAWAVFDRRGIVVAGGAGDRGDGQAPDVSTAYRIASCTKSFTAAAIMRLVERRALDLDAPISDWVPAFRGVALPRPDSPVPTVRMLLTMSGGLPTDDPWADRQESIADTGLDAILRDGLLFDSVPGTRFAYSNLGYALIGRVVSAASGMPYAEFVRRELLEPLQLEQTRFEAPTVGAVAIGHRPVDGRFLPLPWTGPGAFSSIGGLFSTAADLSTWCRYLAAAFERGALASPAPPPSSDLPGPASPVGPSPAARRAMQQAYRVIPSDSGRGTGYGFGLIVEERAGFGTVVSHSGGYPGYSAHMRWSIPDGIGVVAFENATGSRVIDAAEPIHDEALRALRPSEPGVPILDATRAAQHRIMRLLALWDDQEADRIFTENVALDAPYEERRTAIAALLSAAGVDPATCAPTAERSNAPTQLSWRLIGNGGSVRVSIRLAPLRSGRVQTLSVARDDGV